MNETLLARLKTLINFPSPPGVATQIIQLAQDPNIELGKLAKIVSLDPALASKILRVANSALYGQRRKSNTLNQALVVLGLNATLTLALSFSLVKSLKGNNSKTLDHNYFWQRALLSANAARVIGEKIGLMHAEELFLGGLLQDIGMLALDQAQPDLYKDIGATMRDHLALTTLEKERVGLDHADAGVFILENWNMPLKLQAATRYSHSIEAEPEPPDLQSYTRCIALSGMVADLYIGKNDKDAFKAVAASASEYMDLDAESIGEVLQICGERISEVAQLFEMDDLSRIDPVAILEQAREILMLRNLQSIEEVSSLRKVTMDLETRAKSLEEQNRLDSLTGLYNRKYFDEMLERDFADAVQYGWELSIGFADLDHFKQVNDTYGHQAGDTVLKNTAELLFQSVRSNDIVARYGGEEFILLFRGATEEMAKAICARTVKMLEQQRHDIGVGKDLQVTLSIGIATLNEGCRFRDAEALVKAADHALYSAKLMGRNCAMHFTEANQNKAFNVV